MIHCTPIELLEERLSEYEKALQKSFISFSDNKINEAEFIIHKKNLQPKIFDYKQAIEILKNWTT